MHSDQMVKGPITHLKDILYELENTQNICNGPQKKKIWVFFGESFYALISRVKQLATVHWGGSR